MSITLSFATLPSAIPPEVLMRLIGLAVVLALSLILVPLGAEAQPPGWIPRVGLLTGGVDRQRIATFREGLRQLGYVEGTASSSTCGQPRANPSGWPDSQLIWSSSRLLSSSRPVRKRFVRPQHATKTIPIVMALAGDPVGSG